MNFKKLTLVEWVTYIGVAATILLMLSYTVGCAHKPVPQGDQCCERLSLHHTEMDKFNRYCKVALFLAKSTNKAVGTGVRKGARDAVEVCKFVFNVDTDDELVAAGDQQDYYRVRSYIIPNPADNGGWIHPACDPAEIHCEEF